MRERLICSRFRKKRRNAGSSLPFTPVQDGVVPLRHLFMMPLWGGYAYRPWLFYGDRGEHPSTEEYVYQDFHHNGAVVTSDFKPALRTGDQTICML